VIAVVVLQRLAEAIGVPSTQQGRRTVGYRDGPRRAGPLGPVAEPLERRTASLGVPCPGGRLYEVWDCPQRDGWLAETVPGHHRAQSGECIGGASHPQVEQCQRPTRTRGDRSKARRLGLRERLLGVIPAAINLTAPGFHERGDCQRSCVLLAELSGEAHSFVGGHGRVGELTS
jgi:hypothetical protein